MHLETMWTTSLRSVENHATAMASRCDAAFGELIQEVTRRFCSQDAPVNQEELSARQMQVIYVSGVLSQVSHADSMAKITPSATQQILDVIAPHAQQPLPSTQEESARLHAELIAVTSTISAMCHAGMLRH